MLVVKPDLSENHENETILRCCDDETPVGFVRFRQNGYIIEVIDIAPNPMDPEEIKGETYTILDTIIRALGSFALNRSCYYLESESAAIFPTLEKLRFSFSDEKMKSDLSKILSRCR